MKNTNWDESNKIQHDYVFSYVYGVKDSQSYDVNSAYGQNVTTKLGRWEYILGIFCNYEKLTGFLGTSQMN